MTHLVVTVHGIRTFGGWQERLEALLTQADQSGTTVLNYRYGYFSVLAFLMPPLRWLGVRKTLTPEQKSQAAESFGAEGDYLSAGKKLLDTKHEAFRRLTGRELVS